MSLSQPCPTIRFPLLSFTLFLSILTLFTYVNAASFFTLSPFNGHKLRFYGTLNCTSAGEPDCTDTLGIMHIAQRGGNDQFKYANLNLTIVDGYNSTEPYQRWTTSVYMPTGAVNSISAQFPLDLTTPQVEPPQQIASTMLSTNLQLKQQSFLEDKFPIGIFFGEVELYWANDQALPLPYSEAVYEATLPYYSTSTFALTFGDLQLNSLDVYRNLHDTHPVLNPDVTEQSWQFHVTLDAWALNKDDLYRTATPQFTVILPRPTLHYQDKHFNTIVSNDDVYTEEIASFQIDLVGPIQFWSTHGRIRNIPCIITTYGLDPKSKFIEADSDILIQHTYNWHGNPILPLGWPQYPKETSLNATSTTSTTTRTTETTILQDDKDNQQPELFTSFQLTPMATAPDVVQIDQFTTSIDIQCSSVGSLQFKSLFPFHPSSRSTPQSPSDTRLHTGDVPIVETIPTFASISFNTTNSQSELYMMSIPHSSPIYIQPDPTDGISSPDQPVSLYIIIAMSGFATALVIGLLVFLKIQYNVNINIPCCPDCSKCCTCCRSRSKRIQTLLADYRPYDKTHPSYGLSYDQYREKVVFYEYGQGSQSPTIDQYNDDPNNFQLGNDGLTSRNTDLAGLMSDPSELPRTASTTGMAVNGRGNGRNGANLPHTQTTTGAPRSNHDNNANSTRYHPSTPPTQPRPTHQPQQPRNGLYISESYAKRTGQYTQQNQPQQNQQRYNSSVGLPSHPHGGNSGTGYGSFQ